MKKKFLGKMGVSLGLSAMVLTACGGANAETEVVESTTKAVVQDIKESEVVKEVEVEVETEAIIEDKEISTNEIVFEKKLSDSYSVDMKSLLNSIKSGSSESEKSSDNSLGFEKIDMKNAFGIASSFEKKTGIRQYEMFKTEIPSDVTYLGIFEEYGLTASLFFRGDVSSKENFVVGLPMFADLGAQGLNDYGIRISFSECTEEAREEYLKSFIVDDESVISSMEVVEYGGVPFYFSTIDEEGAEGCGKIGFTIENNQFIMLMFISDISMDEVDKLLNDIMGNAEFNFEHAEKDLNIVLGENIDVSGEMNEVETEVTDDINEVKEIEETKANEDINLIKNESINTYNIAGTKLVLAETLLSDVGAISGVQPEIDNSSILSFVDYNFSSGNTAYFSFLTLNGENYLKSINISYSPWSEIKAELEEIPYGTTLQDMINTYGEYDSHYEDITYTWNLSENIELTVQVFDYTDMPEDMITNITITYNK